MRKQIIAACVIFFLALMISIGSVSFLGPCVHDDGTAGACHWASRCICGLGLLLLALSLLAVFLRRARIGLYLSISLTCVLGFFCPGTLIDLCRMSSMHCRAVMQPAMMILFAAAGLISLTGILLCIKEQKGEKAFS